MLWVFWAWFPLLYSKAWMLLCMFRSKQQLSELWYCWALFIEEQRTIILKVHESSKTNRLRASWVNLEANLPHVTYYTPRWEVQALILSALTWEYLFTLKKLNSFLMTRWPSFFIYFWFPTVKKWLHSTFRHLKSTLSKL